MSEASSDPIDALSCRHDDHADPEQQAWIDAHVARDEYASAEEATRRLLDDAIAQRAILDDDLSWAKPLVDEALAEVERGETISWEQSRAEFVAILDTFETR